jgi:hypothetical protein
VDEFVSEQPELFKLIEHLLVVNVPVLLIGMLLPVKVNVLLVALNVPEFAIEHGLPDIANVAPERLTVPELARNEP